MSDLVKRLRDEHQAMTRNEAADRIEQLEREVSRLIDAFAKNDKRLRDQLAAEKALADRLYNVLYASAFDGKNRASAAYRKTRGL